jgi:hypothetical protein
VVDDLTDTMAVNDRHEVILYKKMTLGSVALALLRHEKPDLVLIQNTPIESHVRVLPTFECCCCCRMVLNVECYAIVALNLHASWGPCLGLILFSLSLSLSQVKQKKDATTGDLLCFQVDLNVEQLLLSLNADQYQLCRCARRHGLLLRSSGFLAFCRFPLWKLY